MSSLVRYTRFARELRRFLKHPLTLADAGTVVRERLKRREAHFLRLVERSVFGHARSPYLALMKRAHCELGDLQRAVRARGLEPTLSALRGEGVYVTFEEFKGRRPIERGGQVIPVRPEDFDNPDLQHHYQTESGGSTGQATRISIDLGHLAAQAPYLMLTHAAHGVLEAPVGLWRGILPDTPSVNDLLRNARFGRPPEKWFSPIRRRDLHGPYAWKYWLTTYAIVAWSRLNGVPFPWPEYAPLEQAGRVARWIADTVQAHGACVVRTNTSKALRVCLSAGQAGIDLTGATFIGAGEPPTPAKVRGILQTGARYVPVYFISEIGAVGMGCARPVDGNDLHFLKDSLALIPYSAGDLSPPGLCLTTLLPTVPKLMLNVETDDFGWIERRACGCPLEEHGWSEHVRGIHSHGKLTGEGLTLVGGDMVRILEEVLPSRFGGSPLDYQWEEEEDERGLTRLTLRASPRLGPIDEAQVVKAVVAALLAAGATDGSSHTILAQSRALRVRRAEPRWSARGKLLPLRPAGGRKKR